MSGVDEQAAERERCEFSKGGRECQGYAVADILMPPGAPKPKRSACHDHAEGFETVRGVEVQWLAEERPS